MTNDPSISSSERPHVGGDTPAIDERASSDTESTARATELARAWDAALPVEAYVESLWRKHRSRFLRNRDRTPVPQTLLGGSGGTSLNILVLTEPWCEDSAQLVPMLWRLAGERPDVVVRVAREHEHRDLASRYQNAAGHPAIPTFILLDADRWEIGALVERPRRVTEEVVAELRRFQTTHPALAGIARTLDRMPEETRAAAKGHIAEWREGQHERWAGFFFDELSEIITRDDRSTGSR